MAFVSAGSFSALFTPLAEACGSGLSLRREGNAVCWSFAGLRAYVEMDDEGTIRATFADEVTGDDTALRPFSPIYRARDAYLLSGDGARRLADDLVAFFSGTREPRFVFSGFRESEPGR